MTDFAFREESLFLIPNHQSITAKPKGDVSRRTGANAQRGVMTWRRKKRAELLCGLSRGEERRKDQKDEEIMCLSSSLTS